MINIGIDIRVAGAFAVYDVTVRDMDRNVLLPISAVNLSTIDAVVNMFKQTITADPDTINHLREWVIDRTHHAAGARPPDQHVMHDFTISVAGHVFHIRRCPCGFADLNV